MIEITLSVEKDKVYKEVAKTTEYAGSKMSDSAAYELIPTTDEDKDMLERFWEESKNIICNVIKKVIISAKESGGQPAGVFILTLGLSNSFDENLTESMQSSLFSFFVMNIVSKWFSFINKEESASYSTEGSVYLEDIKRKAFYKKSPVRPIIKKDII